MNTPPRKFFSLSRHVIPVILMLALIQSACRASTPTPAQTSADLQPTSALSLIEQPTIEPTSTSGYTGPKQATFIFTQEFDTLNPLYTTIWLSSITQQLWNCWAWDFDEQNNPRPVLVKEIPSVGNRGISADGKVVTLKLREDLVWSDGDPLTAEDFLFTYQMAVSPQNSTAPNSPYKVIDSITTPDERTVVINFKEPYAPWLVSLWQGILPAHILKPVFETNGSINNAEWNMAPTVGCGPYVFSEWEKGNFARFVSNEKYWLGIPKISEITIRFVTDDAAQVEALKTGEGDLGTYFPFEAIPELETAGITTLKVFSGYNEGLLFYLHPAFAHPALQDLRVRQAIALAIDSKALTETLHKGLTQPAVSLWDNTPFVDPSLKPWPYEPERAKQLLDEAGWIDTNGDGSRDKDGIELLLTYGTTTRQVRQDTQKVVQSQLEAIGIKVELYNYDLGVFLSSFGAGGPAATGQLDIFQYSVRTSFPDPDTPDFLCSEIPTVDYPLGRNWISLCDQELDQLFKTQASQMDFQARQQTYYQISRLIYERVYFIGLWQDPDLWGINSRLSNVKISGVTPFFNILEWDITR